MQKTVYTNVVTSIEWICSLPASKRLLFSSQLILTSQVPTASSSLSANAAREWNILATLDRFKSQLYLTRQIAVDPPEKVGPSAHIYIFNFLISWYWLTDPFPGLHQWVRRLLLELRWESSWQLLSIKLSCTPSSKATREVSILRAVYAQSDTVVDFSGGFG